MSIIPFSRSIIAICRFIAAGSYVGTAQILNAEIGPAAVAGISAVITIGSGFDFKTIEGTKFSAESLDSRSVRQLFLVPFDFAHCCYLLKESLFFNASGVHC